MSAFDEDTVETRVDQIDEEAETIGTVADVVLFLAVIGLQIWMLAANAPTWAKLLGALAIGYCSYRLGRRWAHHRRPA